MATRKRTKVRSNRPLKEKMQELDSLMNLRFRYNDLERSYLLLEKDYAALRARLVSLLNEEQIDAAKTCGVSPEMYCLEWVDLIKDDIVKYAPGFYEKMKGVR